MAMSILYHHRLVSPVIEYGWTSGYKNLLCYQNYLQVEIAPVTPLFLYIEIVFDALFVTAISNLLLSSSKSSKLEFEGVVAC